MLFNFTNDFNHRYIIMPLIILGCSFSMWWTSIWLGLFEKFKKWNQAVIFLTCYFGIKNLLNFLAYIFCSKDQYMRNINYTWTFVLILNIISIVALILILFYEWERRGKKFKFLYWHIFYIHSIWIYMRINLKYRISKLVQA